MEKSKRKWGKWELSELPLEAVLEDLNKRLLQQNYFLFAVSPGELSFLKEREKISH